MLTLSAIQNFFHADYSGTYQLLTQILEPIFGEYDLGYDEITKNPTIKDKAKGAHIKTIKHVATFWAEGLDIKVFDVTLEDNCHIHIARKNIQLLVREYVEKFEGAFIVFHYENTANRSWRLSYLEKRQNTAASTNAKRYTYLCGKDYPCRTIAERFYALQNQDLNAVNLEKAFSVEALSDEFFSEYTAQYNNICKYIYENRKDTARFGEEFADCEDKFIRDYVKKMMGRITFLHFLQKKGWMGVPLKSEWGQGDVNFMRHLFEYATPEQQENFLDEILEPLFFDCLNSPRNNDEFDTHITKIGKVRIPYLNGGLFEKDDIDKPQSTLPSQLFKDLLDFYARFNFTIDENDPLDAEVGVDPEMLGKIFENLLEDNKDKGAFYTPKEIVNYMCKESLIAYLITEAQQASEVNKQRQENFEAAIRALVEDPEMTVSRIKRYDEKQLEVLSKALMEVKICDPAIGSGAFPMGLLNLLFKCRNAVNDALGIGVPPAELKKDIIRNNIYGVDIEKGAIDIARLRFWLSIVVDLKEPEALPNFDYKFMQGNSLLEQFEGKDLSNMFANAEDRSHMKVGGVNIPLIIFEEEVDSRKLLLEQMNNYFSSQNGENKNILRSKVNNAVKELIIEKFGHSPAYIEKINDIDISGNDQFFLWHTWFAEVFNRPSKQGFDIVIGNPPYVSSKDLKIEDKKLYKKHFVAANNQMDLYTLFIELATILLRPNGISSYIVPDSLIGRSNFESTRKMIICDKTILKWVHLNEVFSSANVASVIYVFKNQYSKDYTFIYEKSANVTNWNNGIFETIKVKKCIVEKTENYKVNFSSEAETSLLFKIKSHEKLQTKMIMWRGEELGRRSELIRDTETKTTIPLLAGDNVHRYECINWSRYIRKSDVKKLNYENPKILIRQLGTCINATIDYEGCITLQSIYNLALEKQNITYLEFVLGLLNSKLYDFIYSKIAGDKQTFQRIILENIKTLPIPQSTKEVEKQVSSLVDSILDAKRKYTQTDSNQPLKYI